MCTKNLKNLPKLHLQNLIKNSYALRNNKSSNDYQPKIKFMMLRFRSFENSKSKKKSRSFQKFHIQEPRIICREYAKAKSIAPRVYYTYCSRVESARTYSCRIIPDVNSPWSQMVDNKVADNALYSFHLRPTLRHILCQFATPAGSGQQRYRRYPHREKERESTIRFAHLRQRLTRARGDMHSSRCP